MFDNIGWEELLIIVVAGLFILGPERLPAAAQWLGKTVRKVRDYATGARDQLKGELGPEFEELRKPLEDLRSLRSLNPRTAITQHLLDGYDPVNDLRQYDVREDFNLSGQPVKPNGYSASTPNGSAQPTAQPTGPAITLGPDAREALEDVARRSAQMRPSIAEAMHQNAAGVNREATQRALQMDPLAPGERPPFDPDAT